MYIICIRIWVWLNSKLNLICFWFAFDFDFTSHVDFDFDFGVHFDLDFDFDLQCWFDYWIWLSYFTLNIPFYVDFKAKLGQIHEKMSYMRGILSYFKLEFRSQTYISWVFAWFFAKFICMSYITTHYQHIGMPFSSNFFRYYIHYQIYLRI